MVSNSTYRNPPIVYSLQLFTSVAKRLRTINVHQLGNAEMNYVSNGQVGRQYSYLLVYAHNTSGRVYHQQLSLVGKKRKLGYRSFFSLILPLSSMFTKHRLTN